MHLRRVSLENVRSFRERATLDCEGMMTILVGPNGGGKTNLLDAAAIMLRRYLFASMYAIHDPTPENPDRHSVRENDALNQLILEKHSVAPGEPQILEIEIEVTARDIEAMQSLKDDAEKMMKVAEKKYVNLRYQQAADWEMANLDAGMRLRYSLVDGTFQVDQDRQKAASDFQAFLKLYEIDGQIREEMDMAALATPMVYLPVNRTANAISSSVDLAGYNMFEQKRQSDAAISRTQFSLAQVAVGRLALRHRLILDRDTGRTDEIFKEDGNLIELTRILKNLGYDWEMLCTNPSKNSYDVMLSKQGTRFLVSRASSGERELLTYLFTIFGMNVRDALILIDEPELHLHPRWQAMLLNLFEELSEYTGNQFIFATHSPKFISPKSVQFVSRVFSEDQNSKIVQLESGALPKAKHLLNIVNTQNNEKVFFSDLVVLVEGISDRVFFEAVFEHLRPTDAGLIYEVVDVGGKGFFESYQELLNACRVKHVVIADLDYVEQVGSAAIKALFATKDREIKKDVIENAKSLDAEALVGAVDEAMRTSSWDHAADVWEYIKSRRRQLRTDLAAAEVEQLQSFLVSKQSEGVFILSRGALEQYLPSGCLGLAKLIELVSSEVFWEGLPPEPRAEISEFVETILPKRAESPPTGTEGQAEAAAKA
jgi:putative ATP-dependent endonuclease of OLD family